MASAEAISTIERRHHDLFASRFDTNKMLRWFRSHSADELWKEIRPLLKGSTVLDIGCGLGFDTILLAKLGFRVTAIDLSPESLERARALARIMKVDSRCTFKLIDLNIEFVDGKYDIVFGRAVLHHLTGQPMSRTLRMLERNLESCGVMIFIEPLDKNPAVWLNRRLVDPYDRTPTERPLNLFDAVEAFRQASLKVAHREYYLTSTAAHFFKKVLRNEVAFNSARRCLMALDQTLMNLFPPLRSYAWISVLTAWHNTSS